MINAGLAVKEELHTWATWTHRFGPSAGIWAPLQDLPASGFGANPEGQGELLLLHQALLIGAD
jgi:hypothetical protein